MKLFRIALMASAVLAPGVALADIFPSVGPHYHAPVTAPVTVLNAAPEVVDTAAAEAAWWNVFEDPVLNDLIERSGTSNLDLRAAFDRVRQSRALFNEQQLNLLPHVTTDATYNRSDEQFPGFGTARFPIESADLGFDASWEIDLFGHVRHSVEAARADADASQADARDTGVTVMAEVARNYFELRGAQARLAVARENAKTQNDTLRLTQVQFQVGQGDPVDVQSARARLNATEATIPDLTAAESRARYRLAVLLGLRPGALDDELKPLANTPAGLIKPLPIGDASQFLRRRPDVQAAERRVAAETARTGIATADLFPRVNVTGFVGLLSGDVSKLFNSNAQAWSVSPQITWAGLDLGSVHARLRAQSAKQDEALASYDKTVLQAIEDLENALTAYRQEQLRITSLAQQVDASRQAAALARIRYKEGSIDFLVLLDAERTRLAAEDGLTAAQTESNTDIVAIYKALGGGWS
jgi:multidrug efflux system outer membrane protein